MPENDMYINSDIFKISPFSDSPIYYSFSPIFPIFLPDFSYISYMGQCCVKIMSIKVSRDNSHFLLNSRVFLFALIYSFDFTCLCHP